jgi:hypothetical protein
VGIGCGALLLLSCCAWGGLYGYGRYAAESISEDATEAVADATEASGGGGAAATGDVCDRAADCCEAYADSLGAAGAAVRGSCPNYRSMDSAMSGAACQMTIDGYRQSISATGGTVPASCQ